MCAGLFVCLVPILAHSEHKGQFHPYKFLFSRYHHAVENGEHRTRFSFFSCGIMPTVNWSIICSMSHDRVVTLRMRNQKGIKWKQTFSCACLFAHYNLKNNKGTKRITTDFWFRYFFAVFIVTSYISWSFKKISIEWT